MAVGGTRGSTSAGSPPWTSTTPSQRSFPFSRRRWPIRPAHVAWLDTCGVKWKGGSGRPACRRPIRARPHGRLEDRRCFTRLSTQLYAGLEKNARRTSQRIRTARGGPRDGNQLPARTRSSAPSAIPVPELDSDQRCDAIEPVLGGNICRSTNLPRVVTRRGALGKMLHPWISQATTRGATSWNRRFNAEFIDRAAQPPSWGGRLGAPAPCLRGGGKPQTSAPVRDPRTAEMPPAAPLL